MTDTAIIELSGIFSAYPAVEVHLSTTVIKENIFVTFSADTTLQTSIILTSGERKTRKALHISRPRLWTYMAHSVVILTHSPF